jgi:hypothetical protein
VVLSAWIPEGALSEVSGLAGEAVSRALGTPPAGPRFAWHDRGELTGLLGPRGFEVTTEEHRLGFTAKSPRDHMEGEAASHPLALASRAVLEPRGEYEALRERVLAIYEAANEDPHAFRLTSRYVVVTARRS